MGKIISVPFHKPYLDNCETEAVKSVLESGWLTMGAKTFEFESMFAEKVGARHAIALNSGTSAIHLALSLYDLKPDDEVIVPAVTFVATAESVRYFGARPVFADVEPDTHNISVDSVRSKINHKTKGIIPVHYSGLPADMDALREIAVSKNIFIIEDAAHAFPSYYKGKAIGSFDTPAAFSFYANKTITTGEGGILTLNDDNAAERAKKMRLHGIDKDAWKRYSGSGSWKYDVTDLGYKYNPTDISSAIGVEQLKKSDIMTELRKRAVAKYNSLLSDCEYVEKYPVKDDRLSSYYIYPVKIRIDRLKVSRDYIADEMNKRGITVSVHFIPLYRFTYYSQLEAASGNVIRYDDYPGSEYVYERGITLPLFPSITDDEIEYVAENLINIILENRK